MTYFKPEVLSPAGSFEALEAAVRSGADAVYIGATRFSARRNADNFDDEQLKSAAEYCRIRGVKLYLALNIMVKQGELSDALSLARYAQEIGIDALIVADLGLARLIHATLPDLPLHASTQMTVHSPAALKALKRLGFSRVVVSREMSGKALETFCREAAGKGIEVEVFVHGALCMSVSGQCLLSAMLGERSGNRGLCAGPCRLPFAVENGSGYDLSLKDLSLLEHISELKAMGVSSLKIEGRMKRPEYIAAATAAARSAVDSGYVSEELSATLKGVFSRSGFTDGYFTDKKGYDMFGIRTKDDVICAKDTFAFLHSLYRIERQRVAIGISGIFRAEEPMQITFSDGINSATATGDIPDKAKSREITSEDIKKSLSKLGSTPYFSESADIIADSGLFISNSQLNALRREAADKLSELRAQIPQRRVIEALPDRKPHPIGVRPQIIAYFDNAKLIPEVLKGVAAVVLKAEAPLPGRLPEGIPLIADSPRWCEDEGRLLRLYEHLKENGFSAAICHTLSSAALAQSAGLRVIAGIGLNLCNSESFGAIADLGAEAAFCSAEATLSDIKAISSDMKRGIFGYGRLPLMVFKNCPLKNGRSCAMCDKNGLITDRLGISFPIRCRGDHAELLNSADIYLADRLPELSGIDFIMLAFKNEDSETVSRIIKEYTLGGKSPSGCTRGLYYRGVL